MGKRLEGKIAVITGANSGLGEAVSTLFASEGASIVIAARRQEPLDAISAKISETGSLVHAVVTDVTSQEGVEKLFAETIEKFGRVDILVNCAGILDGNAGITKASDEVALRLFETNTLGTMRCMQAALKYMLPAGAGSIVNVASVAGVRGQGGAAYCMSKGGVVALTQCVALQYQQQGIRANVICPGGIITPMLMKADRSTFDTDMLKALAAHTAQGTPLSTAPEQANLILFLASDESSAVNGQAIISDKGNTL
ncbi:MAG: SDR family oxidoreductase [Oscillospiraceae bacterium]